MSLATYPWQHIRRNIFFISNTYLCFSFSFEQMKQEVHHKVDKYLLKLFNIWNDIGIKDEQQEARSNVVLLHISNLLDEMVSEEETLKSRLLENIGKFSAKLYDLCTELKLPICEVWTNNDWKVWFSSFLGVCDFRCYVLLVAPALFSHYHNFYVYLSMQARVVWLISNIVNDRQPPVTLLVTKQELLIIL